MALLGCCGAFDSWSLIGGLLSFGIVPLREIVGLWFSLVSLFRLLNYLKVSDCHPTIVQYRSLKATGQSNGETPEPKKNLLPSKLVFSGILSQQQALTKADVLSPECQLLGSRGEAPSSALSLGRYEAHVRRSIFFLFKLSEELT